MKIVFFLGLALGTGVAHGGATLTFAGGQYKLSLDYLEFISGGTKSAFKANLYASELGSGTVDLASIGALPTNSSSDPSTTPRLGVANGATVLEVPSVGFNGLTYAVNIISTGLTTFSVDASSLKTIGTAKPGNVAVASVASQTVGALSIASTSKQAVSWSLKRVRPKCRNG